MDSHALDAPGRRKQQIYRGLFLLWFVGALLVVSSLGAAHWYAMPTPSAQDVLLARAVERARTPGSDAVLLHFLYARCTCSKRVFAHLLERRADPRAAEHIILVDGEPALHERLRQAGFVVQNASASDLARTYGVTAAPLLVVAGRASRPEYVGGYTQRKQGLEILDTTILSSVRRGAVLRALPLFGCAVSRELQKLLDPLGLKYSPAPGVP